MADIHPLVWYATTINGGLVHAGRREACPFGVDLPDEAARELWHALNDANDPDYRGTFTIRVLCRRGGCHQLPRVWRDLFTTAAWGRTCPECAALHTALYMPPVPGWTRPCTACGKERPVNYFATHKGRSDGLHELCTPCRFEQRWDREFERKYGRPPRRP